MDPRNNEEMIEGRVKKVLGTHPDYKLSDAKTKKFISWLFNAAEEKKTIVEFSPVIRVSIFSGTAAGVLVMAIVMFNFFFSPIYPVVTNIQGTVKIYRASQNEWIFAENTKIKLGKNDILKTFADGRADIIIPNLYHIRLKSDSEIKLARSISRAIPGDIGYVLSKGKIFTHYNKMRTIGKELGIETPQAVATALGTDFMVASTPMMNQTTVGVLDGIVKVNSALKAGMQAAVSKEVFVRAGERTIISQGADPAAPTRLMESELLEMEELYNIGTRPQVALLISTGPTRTRELLSLTPLFISSEKSEILTEKFEPIAREINQAIKEGSKEKHIESIERLEELLRNYPNPKYDVQFLLFIGSYYEYIGEYQKAIATFEKIVSKYPNSSLASIAQCATGIIYEERLKSFDSAKAAYQKVISNYPQSPEVEEASAGLNRLIR